MSLITYQSKLNHVEANDLYLVYLLAKMPS